VSLLAASADSPSRWKRPTTPPYEKSVQICSLKTLLCVKCTRGDELNFPDYSATQNNLSEINIFA
jgi:hypothetical protein